MDFSDLEALCRATTRRSRPLTFCTATKKKDASGCQPARRPEEDASPGSVGAVRLRGRNGGTGEGGRSSPLYPHSDARGQGYKQTRRPSHREVASSRSPIRSGSAGLLDNQNPPRIGRRMNEKGVEAVPKDLSDVKVTRLSRLAGL